MNGASAQAPAAERPPLSAPELRVARVAGDTKWTTKRIAAHLGLSVRRVQVLITSVAVKTGVQAGQDDRVHVAVWWREHGQAMYGGHP